MPGINITMSNIQTPKEQDGSFTDFRLFKEKHIGFDHDWFVDIINLIFVSTKRSFSFLCCFRGMAQAAQ